MLNYLSGVVVIWWSLGEVLHNRIVSSTNKDTLTSSFLTCIHFIFPCLTTLAKTSGLAYFSGSRQRVVIVVPSSSGTTCFSLFRELLSEAPVCCLYSVELVPFIPPLSRTFIVNGY